MDAVKQTVICTGARGGLGTAFAKALASSTEGAKYHAIYTVRDPTKVNELKSMLNSTPANCQSEILALELDSLKCVRAVAERINERVARGELGPIRALVLNAAWQEANDQTKKPKSFTNDGFEMAFGVNYLANFLFVLLLLKSMDKQRGRIIFVSSWTHDPYDNRNDGIPIFKDEKYKVMFTNTMELAKGITYEDDGYLSGMRRYGCSKLALMLFFYELQRRIDVTPKLSSISVLAIDPGAMGGTSLTKESPLFIRIMTGWVVWTLQGLWVRIVPNGFMRPPWKSANDLLLACFETKYLGQHPKAQYLNGSAKAESSVESRDVDKQKTLWADSLELAGLREDETGFLQRK